MSETKPNIVYIMSDDHATQAISSYGSFRNDTPNIDSIADNGMRFDKVYCTNALCAPSRATILTGNYSHVNGVRGLDDNFDGNQQTFPKLMQKEGYHTAIVGKWHLGHGGESDPTGFDYWNILPEQGDYYNPKMIRQGEEIKTEGYVSDIITNDALKWLEELDKSNPFMLMVHHKAPHRPWDPPERYKNLYEECEFPLPENFYDKFVDRSNAAKDANMRIEDLNERDVKGRPPDGLSKKEVKNWKYQRYIRDYLRCVASIDDSVGNILTYLSNNNLIDNTIVIYTSDQGFFLGEHGWYDKRFMYEESLRMPFLIQYPKKIKKGSNSTDIIINNDFAPTLLDFANIKPKEKMQGESFKGICCGESQKDWRTSMYYRYWEHLTAHNVPAHYGIRTEKYKLIYYYGEPLGVKGAINKSTSPEWELFDLKKDPEEMKNLYSNPEYAEVILELKKELKILQEHYQETQ